MHKLTSCSTDSCLSFVDDQERATSGTVSFEGGKVPVRELDDSAGAEDRLNHDCRE